MKNISYHSDLSTISPLFDAFLVDLWGVIHDGAETYDGVHEALRKLKDLNKQIIFISNAPRRARMAVATLERLNIDKSYYDNIITSGECVFDYFKENGQKFSKKFLMIGPNRDDNLLDDLGYQIVLDSKKASFAIVTGFNDDDSPIDEKMPVLHAIKEQGLTLFCANPDLQIVRKSGRVIPCAGVVAKQYEDMGGQVVSFGKPYQEIYNRAFSLLSGVKKERIAVIGDSLITDIKGANDFGVLSYLIPGGILSEKLSITHGQLPKIDKINEVCQAENIYPDGLLAAFL